MKEHEKMMQDLHRLIGTQDFKSKEELQTFFDSLIGKKIPSFPKEALTLKEQAQDLVFEAIDLPIAQGKKKAREALKLNPDCIEAYEYLASVQMTPDDAMVYYKKAIETGRRIFGGEFWEENKGLFWIIHETRPFMRCMFDFSECLFIKGKVKESVAILEEMIELNPNDNQGARDMLLLYLIELNDTEKFQKYDKQFETDGMVYARFNRALFAFKTEGESENANIKLKEAMKYNKFVSPKLLAGKDIFDLPEFHGMGDENEADYYVYYALDSWKKIKGAREWLKKNC